MVISFGIIVSDLFCCVWKWY